MVVLEAKASEYRQARQRRQAHLQRAALTITDDAFMLTDPVTGEIAFSFPLPMIALHVRRRYVPSYAFQGIEMANPSKHWQRKHAEYQEQFPQHQVDLPEVFTSRNSPKEASSLG